MMKCVLVLALSCFLSTTSAIPSPKKIVNREMCNGPNAHLFPPALKQKCAKINATPIETTESTTKPYVYRYPYEHDLAYVQIGRWR